MAIALIWDRTLNRFSTVAPTKIEYTNAILLGWSEACSKRVLFRAGNLGETPWKLWTVDMEGETLEAINDHSQTYGQVTNSVWAVPQMQR